jgi:hypothetical protein
MLAIERDQAGGAPRNSVSPARSAGSSFTYVPRGPAVLIGTTVARHQVHGHQWFGLGHRGAGFAQVKEEGPGARGTRSKAGPPVAKARSVEARKRPSHPASHLG